jgi:hypothetical protein
MNETLKIIKVVNIMCVNYRFWMWQHDFNILFYFLLEASVWERSIYKNKDVGLVFFVVNFCLENEKIHEKFMNFKDFSKLKNNN